MILAACMLAFPDELLGYISVSLCTRS